MNTDAWTNVRATGDHWHELNTELAKAKQRVAELEPQEAAAFVAFEAALAALKPTEILLRDEPSADAPAPAILEACEHCGRLRRHKAFCPRASHNRAKSADDQEIQSPN